MTDRELREASFKLTHVVWLLTGIVEVLIALRIGLKLVAANPGNPFAALIYGVTDLLLWPFFGLTITPSVGQMVLEIPSIFAMIVYALVGWAVATFVWVLLYKPRGSDSVVHVHTTEPHDFPD